VKKASLASRQSQSKKEKKRKEKPFCSTGFSLKAKKREQRWRRKEAA
jgi:hypothetical protein